MQPIPIVRLTVPEKDREFVRFRRWLEQANLWPVLRKHRP